MHVKTSSVPKSKVDIRNKFYEKMKNCMAQVSDEIIPSTKFIEGTNKKEAMKNIEMFDSIIVKCKAKVIEHYCLLGVELANLKFLYYVDFVPLAEAVLINTMFCHAKSAHIFLQML